MQDRNEEESELMRKILALPGRPRTTSSSAPQVRSGSTVGLLTENDVVQFVSAYLRNHGYQIISSANTSQQGIDIRARMHGSEPHELYVEAKGATSSKEGSARYGMGFSYGQQLDHVSRAVNTCMAAYSAPRSASSLERHVALALPITSAHLHHIEQIRPALKTLGILVYWVEPNGEVFVE